MKSRLSDVPAAIRLSRATLRNIHENLFWAFIYNIVGIPLAAGVFIKAFGWQLNPMFGAAAMSLSSFCVVTNALRLNFFKMQSLSREDKNVQGVRHESGNDGSGTEPIIPGQTGDDPVINKTGKEKKTMEKTLKIEGMMCGSIGGAGGCDPGRCKP